MIYIQVTFIGKWNKLFFNLLWSMSEIYVESVWRPPDIANIIRTTSRWLCVVNNKKKLHNRWVKLSMHFYIQILLRCSTSSVDKWQINSTSKTNNMVKVGKHRIMNSFVGQTSPIIHMIWLRFYILDITQLVSVLNFYIQTQ